MQNRIHAAWLEFCKALPAAFALLILAFPVSAHHGVAAYDYGVTVVAKVTVTRFDWVNPHVKIRFDYTDDKHEMEHWWVEMHPPPDLTEHGWTRQTLHPGDVITIHFRPAKDGSPMGLLETCVLPNGIELKQNALLLPSGKIYTLQQWRKLRP